MLLNCSEGEYSTGGKIESGYSPITILQVLQLANDSDQHCHTAHLNCRAIFVTKASATAYSSHVKLFISRISFCLEVFQESMKIICFQHIYLSATTIAAPDILTKNIECDLLVLSACNFTFLFRLQGSSLSVTANAAPDTFPRVTECNSNF